MPDSSSNTHAQDLKQALLDAIDSGKLIDPEPFLGLPTADGYRIQADIFRSLGQPLKGSKLGLKGDVCNSAPLLTLVEDGRHPYQAGISIEVELAFTLGKDITTGAGPVTRQDVVDAIDTVRIGVELVKSRYVGGSRGDPGLTVADVMSNVSYLLGPQLDRALLDEGASVGQMSVLINSRTVFDKQAFHNDGDPLKSVVVIANQTPISPFVILKAGQVVTTGTLCGLIAVGEPGKLEVDMGGQQFVFDLG